MWLSDLHRRLVYKNTCVSKTHAIEVKWLGYVAKLIHVMKELIAYETCAYTKIWEEGYENLKLLRPCHQGIDCIKVDIS